MKTIEKQNNERYESRVAFALYFGFLILSLVAVFFVSTMTYPEEFTAVSSAAVFLDKDWSSVIAAPWSLGNMLGGIIYLPALLLCPDPIMRYQIMIAVGAAIFSFVPVIVFNFTKRFSVPKLSQRVIIAILCGFYSSMLVNSRFMFSDSYAALAVWLLIKTLMREVRTPDKKAVKLFSTLFAALLTVIAYFSSPACVAIIPSVIIFCIYMSIAHKKKPIYMPLYFVLTALIFAGDIFATKMISDAGIYSFSGGFASFAVPAADILVSNPWVFVSAIAGRIYYFITSTWGIGAFSFALTIYAAVNYSKKRKTKEEQVFSENFVSLGIFCIITVIAVALSDSFFSLADYGKNQNVILGSLPSDLIAAPSVCLLFVHLYRYGINYIRIMATIAGTALLEAGTMLIIAGTLSGTTVLDTVKSAPLFALRPDTAPSTPFFGENIFYPICMLFIAFAVIIPIVCCAGKHSAKLISAIFASLLIYSSVISSVVSIFAVAPESRENAEVAGALTECVAYGSYDNNYCIAVMADEAKVAMYLQYFNADREVIAVQNESEIPKHCFVISENRLRITEEELVLIGRTKGYNIYAKGTATGNMTDLDGENIAVVD